jgi:nucleoside-diphosphate kinase
MSNDCKEKDMERTLVILKPDTVRRKLAGEIISRFEKRNLTITHMKMMDIEKNIALEHYYHVRNEPIFEDMINYITSGSVIVLIIAGNQVIGMVRTMIGKTSSFESLPGTIRGDYGLHRFENLIHASDSIENAEIEIQRFFPELNVLQ